MIALSLELSPTDRAALRSEGLVYQGFHVKAHEMEDYPTRGEIESGLAIWAAENPACEVGTEMEGTV